mgnify:CR=1 FL=1
MSLRILIKIPTFASMKNFKLSIKGYLLAFLSFEILVTIFISIYSRLEQMELINLNHSKFFDLFFLAITNTAEVVLPIAFLIFLFFKRKDILKPYILSYVLSTLVIQVLKHLVFSEAVRPVSS